MVHLYQKIENHFNDKLPFVVYSKPNSTKMVGIFQNDSILHEIKNYDEKGFAFVSFDGKSKNLISIDNSTFYGANTTTLNEKIENTVVNDNLEEQIKFENIVQKAILNIKNKDFEKVVLSRKEKLKLDFFDYLKSFKLLIDKYPTAFRYLLFHPKAGLWMGATPEKFIEIKNNRLKTMALAGTQLFLDNVNWSSKEINEQKIVTEFIKSNLEKYTSKIKVSKPYTFQAGNLVHIRTDIEAEIESELKSKIINDLHPTPAVCGLPKEKAKEFILKNENYEREFYAGFLGELNMKINDDFNNIKKLDSNFDLQQLEETDLYVNLRCMKIEEKMVSIFVGCGITEESNPFHEFLETVNKTKTMKNIIVS